MWYYPVLKAGHCILAYQSIIEHFEFKHKWCCLKTQCLLIFEMATFVPACIIQQLCHIIERQFWRDTNDLLLNNLAFKRLIKNWLFAAMCLLRASLQINTYQVMDSSDLNFDVGHIDIWNLCDVCLYFIPGLVFVNVVTWTCYWIKMLIKNIFY